MIIYSSFCFEDASAVKAEGAGLKDAVTGQKSHILISTLDAGSGKQWLCMASKPFFFLSINNFKMEEKKNKFKRKNNENDAYLLSGKPL